MGQLIVRKFDDHLKARLKVRAQQRGVSMEQEARNILRDALLDDERQEFGMGSRIAALFEDIEWGDETLEPFPASEVRPATFD